MRRPANIRHRKRSEVAPHGKISQIATIDDVLDALSDLCSTLQITASPSINSKLTQSPSERPTTRRAAYADMGRLLTAWHQNAQFLDEDGNPLALKKRGRHSFANLCRITAPGISAKKLLENLKKWGAVTVDERGCIRVQTRSLDVYKDKRVAAEYTLSSLVSYIRTLIHNYESNTAIRGQLFHRIAVNDELSGNLLPSLKIHIRRQGQGFLESFDNWMTRRNRIETTKNKKRSRLVRASVGVYLSVDEKRRLA